MNWKQRQLKNLPEGRMRCPFRACILLNLITKQDILREFPPAGGLLYSQVWYVVRLNREGEDIRKMKDKIYLHGYSYLVIEHVL